MDVDVKKLKTQNLNLKKKINQIETNNMEMKSINASTVYQTTFCPDSQLGINESLLEDVLNNKRIKKKGEVKEYPLNYYCILCMVSFFFKLILEKFEKCVK
jgi:hypothetical protein